MVAELVKNSQAQFADVGARMASVERFTASVEATAGLQAQLQQQRPAEVVGMPAARSRPSTPRGTITPRGAEIAANASANGGGSGLGPYGSGYLYGAMPAIPATVVAAPAVSPRGMLDELGLQRKGSGTGPALDAAQVEAETRDVVSLLRASSGIHQAPAAAPEAAAPEASPAAPADLA